MSLLMAKTYRQNHPRGTSAMAPSSDIPAAMSDFELNSSALTPGSDVADTCRVRGVMTHSRHLGILLDCHARYVAWG